MKNMYTHTHTLGSASHNNSTTKSVFFLKYEYILPLSSPNLSVSLSLLFDPKEGRIFRASAESGVPVFFEFLLNWGFQGLWWVRVSLYLGLF
mgnify:FL=1